MLLQAFPYQGSKRNLAPKITSYLPLTSKQVLVEPFAGSAAVSVYAAQHFPDLNFWLNDIDEPLMDMWVTILQRPGFLANQYQILWEQQQVTDPDSYYYETREAFNSTSNSCLLFYLLHRCVKSSPRYNQNGEFNQSPDKRRLGTHPSTVSKRLHFISKLMGHRTHITSMDYSEIISKANGTHIWYLDPPYQGVTNGSNPRYVCGVDRDDLVTSVKTLTDKRVPFGLSYDGKTANRSYGFSMPKNLHCMEIELVAGRSATSTLLGKEETTVEKFYVSEF